MKRFKIRVKVLFVVFLVAWWATGLLLIPIVQDRMFNRRGTWPPWPSSPYLKAPGDVFFLMILGLLLGSLFVGKIKGLLDRFIASLCFIFNQFPALALFLEPGLYGMVVPVGIFAFLTSPWNPLLFSPFPPHLWLTIRDVMWILFRINVSSVTGNLLIYFILLFPIGLGLFTASFIQFLRVQLSRKDRLITSGLYRIVRHPQYLGIILATFGFLFFVNFLETRLITLITWALMVLAYIWLARREEASLQDKYGEEFLAYKRKVSFMLPLPKRRREQPKPKS